MNTSILENGKQFKNYKELCTALEIEVKSSSNSKNAQLKELARFCEFNKSGHKFIISSVYDTPLPKEENRGKSEGSRNNNNVYGDLIQLLILDLLAQCNNGRLSISRSKLLLTINMVNDNYSPLGEHTKQLSEYTDIEEAIIFDFYNTSNSNFKSAVETALDHLMDKRVIWYDKVTKVAEKGTYVHRLATEMEKATIMDLEKEVLEEFNYKQISQVRCSKHWRSFKKKVKSLIGEYLDIEYYYLAYDIIINEKYLHEERKDLCDLLLEMMTRQDYQSELNSTVKLNLIANAEKRQDKAFHSRKMGKYRFQDNYINDIRKLSILLVDNKTANFAEEVKKINLGSTQTTKEEQDFIESFEELIG